MRTSIRQSAPASTEQIASTAYCLWEQAGRPAGRDMEFWLKAEKQIATAPKPATSDPKASPSGTEVTATPSTSTTEFQWKSREENQTGGQPRNGPSGRANSMRERHAASNQPSRSR